MITILLDHIHFGAGRKYRQIMDGIQAALSAGALQPGDRLPPQRELANALGVTMGTVTRAYREIDKLGLVKGEIGRGTFVVGHGSGRIHPSCAPQPDSPGTLRFDPF